VVIRAAIAILLGEVQAVRGVVGRPRTPLVFAVLGDKQPALQRMIVRREPNAVRVPVPPREGLDGGLRVCGVELSSQDSSIADAVPGRTVERRHGRARPSHAVGRISLVKWVCAPIPVLTELNVFWLSVMS